MTEHPTPSRLTRGELALLVSILAAALAMRLLFLDNHGLRNNDFITLASIQLEWGEMIAERVTNNHMPLYFVLLKGWTQVAGLSDAAMRVPTALLGVLGIFALWWVGRMLFGPEVGLLAALLAVWHQTWLEMSFDLRMYGVTMTLGLLAVGCAWQWFATGRGLWLLLYLAAMVMGLLTHLLIFSVPLSLLLSHWISWDGAERRRRLRVSLGLLLPFVILIPLLLWWSQVQYKVGRDEWDLFPSVGRMLRNLLRLTFGDFDVMGEVGKDSIRGISIPLFLLSVAGAVGQRIRRRWQGEELGEARRRAWSLLLWMILVPMAAVYLASMKSNQTINDARYLCAAGMVLPILLAAAWWGFRPRALRLAGAGVCLGVICVQTIFYVAGVGDGLREAMAFLRAESVPGRVAVSGASLSSALAFDHYDVRMPLLNLTRDEDSADVIRNSVREALGDEGEGVYLFLFHSKDSPAREVLGEQTPWLRPIDSREFGESEVHVFERVPDATPVGGE